jgi:hypothetical protein
MNAFPMVARCAEGAWRGLSEEERTKLERLAPTYIQTGWSHEIELWGGAPYPLMSLKEDYPWESG